MLKMDLLNILEDLTDEEFRTFKWFLKQEEVDDIQPIRVSKLSEAGRRDVVDLMVQTYEDERAVKVTMSVLKKITRNDLERRLRSKASGAEGAGPRGTPGLSAEDRVPADERLFSVRKKFINGVSEPVLNQLLDELLQRHIITCDEMDSVKITAGRAEKARVVIDMVRRKGQAASSVLITALCEEDRNLSRELNLV